MRTTSLPAKLVDAARAPYRRCGRFIYRFAGGKLAGDPIYGAIFERGLLQGCLRVLDLGCGLGLLAATLRAAERYSQRDDWPASWPAAPCAVSIRGIELKAATVERARRALGGSAEIVQGDIRVADFGTADAVVVLDVLHYIEADAHRALLKRVHQALRPSGLLLLRVGDAAAGLRFHMGQCWDQTVLLAGGCGLRRLHCRSVAQWRALLSECGFESQAISMSEGTPFANVLLSARPRPLEQLVELVVADAFAMNGRTA
jgi:SAM-dependent methyltransferase